MPIDLKDMRERRKEATFQYFGEDVHVEFWVERITKEFRAEYLRLTRHVVRLRQRAQHYAELIGSDKEQDGTEAAKAEDAAAEKAIEQIDVEDQVLKKQIDSLVLHVLAEWDVKLNGQPAPLTAETMEVTPTDLQGMIIGAIFAESEPMGKANGARNTNNAPLTLRPKAKRGPSRHRTPGYRTS